MENFAAYGKDLDVAFSIDRQGVANRSVEEPLMAAVKDESFFGHRLEAGLQEDHDVTTSKEPFQRPYQVIPEIDHKESSYAISYSKGFESDKEIRSTSASLAMSLGLFNPVGAENSFTAGGKYKTSTLFAGPITPVENQKDQIYPSFLQSVTQKQRQPLSKQMHGYQTDDQFENSIKDTAPPPQVPLRVARPPGEGRGRNQLLPRYWPRITDHELQQITAGDSNCTITPLFEKMLSASDAGRIGRLVLPKACAEAYFPPISQPEGLPLKIQDVSGKDWVFQFRFWPNNNSRMYVLEGVTPCIQSMHLQAGDTVTFSRLDPEGKLVMGYRRAPNSLNAQDMQASSASASSTPISTMSTGNIDGPTSFAGITNLLPHLVKGAAESQSNLISSQFSRSADPGYAWLKSEKGGSNTKDATSHQTLPLGEKKKVKHPGSKSKRVRMDVSDNVEFRITWKEAQDLLRSPPSVSPTVVTIEGYEFEEFEEPPVFGKRTIFTNKTCGPGEDQWAQCDDCASWRRVPTDIFLPTRWTCADNIWDAARNSCKAPQEVDSEEIDTLLENIKENKKTDVGGPFKELEALSGLEALANAATAGENNVPSSSPPAATTKHPRHRPGCTCIVCIQPPSGKGPKHKPTCNCNVCMTVKRRFKTLMMRRKNRQSEREAENASRKKKLWVKEDNEDINTEEKWQHDSCNVAIENASQPGNVIMGFGATSSWVNSLASQSDRIFSNAALAGQYASQGSYMMDSHLASNGCIDLNSQPEREEEMSRCGGRMSMIRLLKNATFPLDSYLNEHGLSSLICHPQMLVPSTSLAGNASDRKVEEYNGYQSSAGLMSYDS